MNLPERARMQQLDLESLQLALLCAQHRSLSAAARAAGISLPRASYRLKRLEEELGAVLFLRSPRGLQPTDAGAILVEHGRDVLSSLHLLMHALQKTNPDH